MFLIGIIFLGCEYPGDLVRNNPSDPESERFVPYAETPGSVDGHAADLNEIHLNWPLYYGVEKYRIFRKRDGENDFAFIQEIDDFRDTTFVDEVLFSDSYYYRVEAIGKNGSLESIESGRILSNFAEKSAFSVPEILSNDPSFVFKTKNNSVLIHIQKQYSNDPMFIQFDLNSNSWNIVNFDHYKELALPRRRLHSHHFLTINDSKFLIFHIFNESDSGWGPWQDFLGIVCDISDKSCTPVGENILQQGHRYVDVAFGRITETKILITAWRFAYLLNLEDYSLTEVPLPLNEKQPSNLASLPNGDIFACGSMRFNAHPNREACQIFDAQEHSWRLTSKVPIPQNILFSETLDGGSVFTITESDDKEAMIYNPDTDIWSVTTESKFATGRNFHKFRGIDLYSFKTPILKLANGNLVRYTSYPEFNAGLAGRHFLEEYDPNINLWVNFYELPDKILYIQSITMLDSNRALIIYRTGVDYHKLIHSAVIYF